MKKLLKILMSLVVVVVLLGAGGFTWAKAKSAEVLGRTIESHTVDFPVPFPLDSVEVAEAGLSAEEAEALALERALERGRHLVASRYACTECHGADFGGGVMVDSPVLGRLLGPNITTGPGGKTAAYTTADWDRIVRHGIRPDGSPSAMPSQDFHLMSDQELSDVVAYIRSMPPVDATVPPVSLGPLGTVLVATGALPLSVDIIGVHDRAHIARPPAAEVSVEFGRHMATVCSGCHGEALAGGKVVGGDPAWPPAGNLTPHADGVGEWSYSEFVTAMREGVLPDGRHLQPPMEGVVTFTRSMTDTELEALWTYLHTLTPVPGN